MRNLMIDDTLFWNLICYLEKINRPTLLTKIQSDLELDQDKIFMAIQYLKNFHYSIHIDRSHTQGVMLSPPSKEISIPVQLSLTEWLALQAYINKVNGKEELQDLPYYDKIKDSFTSIDKQFPEYNLMEAEIPWPKPLPGKKEMLEEIKHLISQINYYQKSKRWIELTFKEKNQKLTLYPHRVISILAGPILIGESFLPSLLRKILLFDIKEIQASSEIEKQYSPTFVEADIEQYTQGIEDLNQKQVRAILKIIIPDQFNSIEIPPNIENTYTTHNGEGQLIWSATTSLDNIFLEWLSKQNQNVEILGPEQLKETLAKYHKNRGEI